MNNDYDFLLFLIVVFIVFGASFGFGYSVAENDLAKQAIENGCAQYNSTTAEFEWIKKQ